VSPTHTTNRHPDTACASHGRDLPIRHLEHHPEWAILRPGLLRATSQQELISQ